MPKSSISIQSEKIEKLPLRKSSTCSIEHIWSENLNELALKKITAAWQIEVNNQKDWKTITLKLWLCYIFAFNTAIHHLCCNCIFNIHLPCSNSWWLPVHIRLCRSWRRIWNSFINTSACHREPFDILMALKKRRLLLHCQSIVNDKVIYLNISINKSKTKKQFLFHWINLECIYHKLLKKFLF